MTSKIKEREIITHLRGLVGDRLYISGNCVLHPFPMKKIFEPKRERRPIFELRPDGGEKTLILIPDGRWTDVLEKLKEQVSSDNKSMRMCNVFPVMYILDKSQFSDNEFKQILGLDFTDPERFILNDKALVGKINDLGLIQSTVIRLDFTTWFPSEYSRTGRFTILLT